MTFCRRMKRKFNASHGSDKSSILNDTPTKHVDKRGRLDEEEDGDYYLDKTYLPEVDLDEISGVSFLNESCGKVCTDDDISSHLEPRLDKTWIPCRRPSDDDSEDKENIVRHATNVEEAASDMPILCTNCPEDVAGGVVV